MNIQPPLPFPLFSSHFSISFNLSTPISSRQIFSQLCSQSLPHLLFLYLLFNFAYFSVLQHYMYMIQNYKLYVLFSRLRNSNHPPSFLVVACPHWCRNNNL
ncbi:hypothetical protein PHAVU_001G029900 [Phaseolus vulgaris]|uniref:Uncharacterized protein n=1 Tax=Phaseolus vulgaris TaxID=3885 RepID=V7CRW2_PHAVU|nr:hypothetical protein PHAVU_001G029900g [Phaseolus vulgaris]ESW32932.1 hypothetical protein PHAVU_001G029900g [Phaseolus vulgaris]